MNESAVSPISGHLVAISQDNRRDITYYDDICGRWGVSFEGYFRDAGIQGGCLRLVEQTLTEKETKQTMALARSEIWRKNTRTANTPVIVSHFGLSQQTTTPPDGMSIFTLEDVFEKTKILTLEKKGEVTLENLILAEPAIGEGVEVPYFLEDYPGQTDWGEGEVPAEDGMTYGCLGPEALLVYQLLISEGYIEVVGPQVMGGKSQVFVTPAGYKKGSSLLAGVGKHGQDCFFICRFLPEIDQLFEEVIQPVGMELGVSIKRMKDIHHIDKIDDRICQEIRSASFVLVDLSDQNFNVAFEAGFALALGKPIVWTMKEPEEGIQMPFDVYTHNCLGWSPDDLSSFREALKFRLLLAMEKAEKIGH